VSITEPEDAAVDVGSWLRNLGLEQYEAAFRENGVSAEVLRHLTADDLKSDFDTCFRNLLSNQPLMGRQKVVGTTDARFGQFSPV
jgi:SAM domain (Sterile alpha motif)